MRTKKTLLFLAVAPLLQGCIPVFYDARVPERRMSLVITDEAGRPLPQARLAIETRALKTPKEGLPATEAGTINVTSPGYMYGGGGLIPFLGSGKPPAERYRVMARGYRSVEFNQDTFFAAPYKVGEEPSSSVNRQNRVDVLVYQRTIVLRKR